MHAADHPAGVASLVSEVVVSGHRSAPPVAGVGDSLSARRVGGHPSPEGLAHPGREVTMSWPRPTRRCRGARSRPPSGRGKVGRAGEGGDAERPPARRRCRGRSRARPSSVRASSATTCTPAATIAPTRAQHLLAVAALVEVADQDEDRVGRAGDEPLAVGERPVDVGAAAELRRRTARRPGRASSSVRSTTAVSKTTSARLDATAARRAPRRRCSE